MAGTGTRKPKRLRRNSSDARSAALTVLMQLESGEKTLDALLENDDPVVAGLSRLDRGLFNQLVFGTLRWRLRLDTVIETYADRPLKKISPTVRNVLRMALFQLLFMDRIPSSAAVNTAVDLVRTTRSPYAAGFINAVLRNTLRDPGRFNLPTIDKNPVTHLAIDASMPHWLVSRWIARMGFDDARRLCQAVNAIPPISLRCNELKNTLPELLAALAPDAESVEIVDAVPGAVNLIRPRQAIHRLPAFAEGRFAVQDGAAQLVSLLLAPQPGQTVLDACAGLGGKTAHLAQLMRNQGRIIAVDHTRSKLSRLESEMRRLGAEITETRQMNLDRSVDPASLPRFDRILLDAPCTGLGVLRRNPDAKWSTKKQAIGRFADRQVRFLDHLAPLIKPGGTLLYSVCSMEPEENERVIAKFLKRHANFAITDRRSLESRHLLQFIGQDGFLRTAPHTHHMDGFFAARLQRAC